MPKDPPVPSASEAVDQLRRGARFRGDVRPYVADGAVSAEALALLTAAVGELEGEPREEATRALLEAAFQTAPEWSKGGLVVRDPRVVEALVTAGTRHPDGAKEKCLEALLESVPLPLLRPHARAIYDDLRREPDATTFLVVGRLKDPTLGGVVDEVVAADPSWALTREAAAAAAAHGDLLTELSALERFEGEEDPREQYELARDLGWMGTDRCLRALATHLRTPAVWQTGPVRTSVRVAIIAGLRTTFTDAWQLFEPQFVDDSAYDRCERFVTERLGVVPAGPRPPFLFKEVVFH